MPKCKGSSRQDILDVHFDQWTGKLRTLYRSKNLKYEDSFNRIHKTYAEAHYNIRRKFDRLQSFAKKRKLSKKELEALREELVDMATYSIMCLMKFCD